ncbi:MAG: DEAD/DEAH box helicase [Gemmataceae bacterium]
MRVARLVGELVVATPERIESILRNPNFDEWVNSISVVVVDEAHLLARHAFSEGAEGEAYRRVRDIAGASHGLLLLSATPVLHNENAFLGMLHLIDPDTHSLEHPDRFHDLVKNRGLVADAVSLLTANALPAVLEAKLENLRPLAVGDEPLQQLLDEMASSEDDTEVRLKGYLQERFQLDHRILRTRRAQDSVEPDLPKRSCTYPGAAVEDQKRAESV